MQRRGLLLLTILVLGVLCVSQESYGFYPNKPGANQTEAYHPTRLIVKFKPQAAQQMNLKMVSGVMTTGISQLDNLNSQFKVKKQEKLFKEFEKTALKSESFSRIHILEVPEGTDLKQMKADYEKLPEVEYAELDYKVELFEEPNDPLFPHQWYLNNLGVEQNGGQGYYGIDRTDYYNHILTLKFGTYDADVDALEVFQRSDEKTVPLVGIIDTGVDLDHEDLAANIWTNPGEIAGNGIDDDHNGFVDDIHGWDFSGNSTDSVLEDNDPTDYLGHGTHCAGIVAAVRDNGMGVSGINTPCKIMVIKTFPMATTSVQTKAIVYAADMGCDVINMSWGGPYPSSLLEDAIDYALSKGTLPVAAAGNTSIEDNLYPGSLPQVLTVGASNSKDEVTYFSTYGEQIDVVAPGEDILSLRADYTDMYDWTPGGAHIINEKYFLADGTSMAAPCVVGVATYLKSVSPGISNDSLISIIERSADDIIYPFGGDSLYSPGKDKYSGYGRVNLNSALQLLSGRLAKIDYPYENAIVSGDMAVMGTASGAAFESYSLEYGEGSVPQIWTGITSSSTPVSQDTLGIWDVAGLPAGLYTLRLTVGDQNQTLIHVILGNNIRVEMTLPLERDTINGYTQIKGSVVVPNFSDYTLLYGQGESPVSWDTIIANSTKMVADGVLGNWSTSFFTPGEYSLLLSVKTTDDMIYTDTQKVTVVSPFLDIWSGQLSATGSLSPAVGDVDGDGYDEIVIGVKGIHDSLNNVVGGGGIEVFTHTGEREPSWPKDTLINMNSSPALGDLDGDGIDDIVICSNNGVHAYLSGSPNWFRSANTNASMFSLSTPVLADLDDDGNIEVLTASADYVYAWHGDGEPVISGSEGLFAERPGVSDYGFPFVEVADLDNDGTKEVIAGNGGDYNPSGLYIWDIQGNVLLGPSDYVDRFSYIFGSAIADVDDDEDLEVIIWGDNTNYFTLSAFKKDGTQATGYPIVLEDLVSGDWFSNPPAIGDLDGDGTLEIVVTVWTLGGARVYAWHQDGTPLGTVSPGGLLAQIESPLTQEQKGALSALGSNIHEIVSKLRSMSEEKISSLLSPFSDDPVFAVAAETFGSPILADINQDGKAEIIVRVGYILTTGYERLFAWDYEGTLVPNFPLYVSNGPGFVNMNPYSPVITDIDRDGKTDIIINTDEKKLLCLELDAAYDSTNTPWPKLLHDKYNSSTLGFELSKEPANVPPHYFCLKNWTDSSITLGWVPRTPWLSSGYNIYRSDISGQPGERINTVIIPQADSQYQVDFSIGQTYYYTITNVDTANQESKPSGELGIGVEPSAPTGLTISSRQAIATLSWLPNTDIVTGYKIYCKAPDMDDYELIDSVANDTTYIDSLPKFNGIYYYRITAAYLTLESEPSSAIEVNFQPSAPAGLTISHNGAIVTLNWLSDVGVATGYKVYRKAPCSDEYRLLDSVASDTTYIDSFPKLDGSYYCYYDDPSYYYRVTAVYENFESEPSRAVNVSIVYLPSPVVETYDWQECSITLKWQVLDEGDGFNVYRSTESEIYGLTPINAALLEGMVDSIVTYQDTGLTNGVTYYYIVAQIVDGILTGAYNEISFTAGTPHAPNLKVRSDIGNIKLFMSSPRDNDIRGYRIFRKEDAGDFQIIDSLCLDSIYVDSSATGGVSRYYKVTAIDTSYLESSPSSTVEGCLILFDQGVVLVDMTVGGVSNLVNGDSVNAFYQRALQSYDYTYLDKKRNSLTLLDLCHYPITILHEEDYDAHGAEAQTLRTLEQYLSIGGKLLIEDRKNLLRGGSSQLAIDFAEGDFRYDLLNIDSAYQPTAWNPFSNNNQEFIGAYKASDMDGYPEMIELDTLRVNHASGQAALDTFFQGKLPGVGYFVPIDSSEVIYRFISAYDSSASNGKAVGLRHITDSMAFIYFDFPLWFVKEDIATEILHQALSDLQVYTGTDVDDENEPSGLPQTFSLSQNYPNPFNPETVIRYSLPKQSDVKIAIYNILGQTVKVLVDEPKPAGNYETVWNGTDSGNRKVASGIYFYRIQADKFSDAKKMVLLK